MRRLGGLLAAWLLLMPLGASAVGLTSQNVTVSPTQLPLGIAAGTATSGKLSVVNDGDLPYDFRTYTGSYNVTGEDYEQSFDLAPGALDVPSWIHLPTRVTHLEPHQSTFVPYTIMVPRSAPSGGYYATLFIETVPGAAQSTGVQHKERVGVVAYLSVPGNLVEHGTVETFTVPFWQRGDPATASLRLGNQGNVYFTADVYVRFSDLLGNQKADIHVQRQVLPETIRHFAMEWPNSPPLGLFKVGGTADFNGTTHVLPQHYVLVVSQVAFISLLVALVVLVALVIWWWRGRRRPKR